MTTFNILSNVLKNSVIEEGLGLSKNRAMDHLDYIGRHMKHNTVPILPKDASWETVSQEEYTALKRVYEFGSLEHLMYFINEVIILAERVNHHPKLVIDHREIEVILYTKDYNDITESDFKLSHQIDEIFDDINYIEEL